MFPDYHLNRSCIICRLVYLCGFLLHVQRLQPPDVLPSWISGLCIETVKWNFANRYRQTDRTIFYLLQSHMETFLFSISLYLCLNCLVYLPLAADSRELIRKIHLTDSYCTQLLLS